MQFFPTILAIPAEKLKRTMTVQNTWQGIRRIFFMTTGALICALGYALFLVPHNIAAGGVGGMAIIVNHFTGWPVGAMYMIMNIPLLVLGFFFLGRWGFVIRTVVAVLIFSAATDIFTAYLPGLLPQFPITGDVLLSAVYGGIVGGVGGGLIYLSGGTLAGTGVIGRIIQRKTGVPLSQIYLYTDGLIVLAAGVVFGWEISLYAMLTLFLNGIASDYTMEGPSSIRTATIVTDQPAIISDLLKKKLSHGTSFWEITGGYRGQRHYMLMCTIYRPQVSELKQLVSEADPHAFVTIGVSHQALGAGFLPLKR